MKFIPIIFSLLLLTTLACSSSDEQREFESEAYRNPSGITQTSSQNEVVTTDPDDWRTAPLFQGLIEIRPPFPNPAQLGTLINFEVRVTGVQGVGGLDVRVRYPNGNFSSIFLSNDNPLDTGVSTFRIDPRALSQDDSDNLARGLHRIFFFDFDGRLISYGDVEVE